MNVQEILSQLERNKGYFPKVAVEEAIACRDEIIPLLLEVLEDVARDPQPFASDQDRVVHIYAMYLLAQFRETRAYPLLVQIFSAPDELAFELVGDTVTEGLGKILASISDGDIGGMASLVENEQANEYVRSAAMEGLLTLVVCGKRSREEVMAYFGSLFHKFDRRPNYAWDALANSCADLCPEEVVEDIRQAYKDGLVDPRSIAWEDIEDALALGQGVSMERLTSRYRLITDVAKEMGWWYCFNRETGTEDTWEEEPGEADDLSVPSGPPLSSFEILEPIRRAQPKVGRNDPCPCGSGKKFKKCCGR